MFFLTIMSIEFLSAHGFATVRSSGSSDSASTSFSLASLLLSSGVAPVGEMMIKDKKQKVQRDVDMMSTTVGGTTVQGSTGDVPEGESSDDGLEKLTQRSDSPRLTNSSGRKPRRLERFLEYNETNVVVAGEKFEIVDVDQRKKARTAVEGSVLDGLDSSQKIGEIILRAEAEKYSL